MQNLEQRLDQIVFDQKIVGAMENGSLPAPPQDHALLADFDRFCALNKPRQSLYADISRSILAAMPSLEKTYATSHASQPLPDWSRAATGTYDALLLLEGTVPVRNLQDLKTFFEEAKRVLRPDGILYIAETLLHPMQDQSLYNCLKAPVLDIPLLLSFFDFSDIKQQPDTLTIAGTDLHIYSAVKPN